jgi:NAD(P)-dependent dehydrogenase (short-subunit alcohol dehydrogenase family)
MAGSQWTAADIPALDGRVAIVTGANSGLGLETARELARHGARVVIACRDVTKGTAALESIRADVGSAAEVSVSQLDLASLASVRAFAGRIGDEFERVDRLINNAGVMAPPRRLTEDGFESQIGTNHLGHFALTGLLLERLLAAPAPRVVTVSSGAHRIGRMHFNDLMGERRYNNWLWYGQSKLSNLLFCFELQRRAVAADTPLLSLAAHPGYARTNLQFAAPRWHEQMIMRVTNPIMGQSAAMGALPTMYAAVQDIPGGSFVGPNGFAEQRGYPHIVTASSRAYNEADQRRLWEMSEQLTGVTYSFS